MARAPEMVARTALRSFSKDPMKRLLQRLSSLRDNVRGNAMLEFALGSGVMILIFTGTFQFGYTFYRYNTLENAVNTGARYASVKKYNSSTSTPAADFLTAVQNVVVYGDPAGGTTPVAPGLTTNNVALTVTFTNSVPTMMTVAITGYTIDSAVATTTLTSKPKVSYPYLGIYAP
jgi:Flp pilus assembly protein TadG